MLSCIYLSHKPNLMCTQFDDLLFIKIVHYHFRGTSTGGGGGSNGGDELKTQFMTREGTYRLMTLSEYSRPNRVGYANNAQGGSGAGVPVRVSFVTVPAPEGKIPQKLMSITIKLLRYL